MRPPEKIYLQIGDDTEKSFDGVDFHDEVSWYWDRIFDTDVEYVIAPRERKLKRWKDAGQAKEK